MLVLTLGVSDKELLLNQREIAIPLLSLGLTPSIWFVVAPVALFIMHLDMVLNLREHMRKLVGWRTACGGTVAPRDMQPFFADFAFAHGVSDAIGKAFYFMLWFTVGVLGPLTLLIVLIKFGRYQSVLTSALHFVLLGVALEVASRFIRAWRAQAFKLSKIDRKIEWLCWIQGLIGASSIVLTGACAYPALFEKARGIDRLNLVKIVSGLRKVEFAGFAVGLAPVLSVPNTVLVSVDAAEKQALELLSQRQTVGQTKFSGKTSVATTGASTNSNGLADLWWKHGSKLDLSDRHLNFADLSGSMMPRVVLRGTKLQGAELNGAELQGAKLNGAKLQGAELDGAQLQGVELDRAKLQGADLSGAQLQGSACRIENAVKLAEADTDWTLCDLQNWRPENAKSAKRIIDQLRETLPAKTLGQIIKRVQIPTRVQIAIHIPAAAYAICGKLTPQMVDVINATRNSGGVPKETLDEWAKAGSPCPIPGPKLPSAPKKPAAKSP